VDAAPDVEAQADVATTAGTETMGADAGDTSSDDVAATAEAAEGEAESVDAVSPAIEGDASEAIQAADAADATDAVDAAGVDADVADAAAGESDLSAVAALAETPAAEVAPAAAAAPAVPVEPPTREELVRAVEEAWRRWRSAPGLPNESMVPVRARFESALTSVLTSYASAFQGTPFDLTNTLKRMKTLCDDVEGVARGGASEAQLGATSVTALATLLKEKLAANTIGGRVNEEAKTRAAADRVRRAQMAWRDLGPVFGTEGHQLEARFHRAVRRFFEQNPGFEQTQHRDQRGGGGDHRGGGGGGGRDQRGDHRGDNRGGQRDQRGGHGARPHGGGGGRPGDQQARTRGAS
jgi:hypothetical protein